MNPYRLVRRTQLILGAAQEKKNTELSVQLEPSRNQVQFWRNRWQEASALLIAIESSEMRQRIEGVLSKVLSPLNSQLY